MDILKLLEIITGLGGIFEQRGLDKEAKEETEARYEQSLSELGGAGKLGGLYGRIMPQLQDLVGQGVASAQEGKRTGERQLADVDRAFTARQGQAKSDLISRGLTGTTVLPGVRAGIEGQRQYARGGVEDQIKRYNFGLDQYTTQLQQQPLNLDQQLTGQRLGIIGSKNTAPGQAYLPAISQFVASLNPPKVEEPEDTSLLQAGITGGFDLAGMGLLGSILK